MKAAALVWVWVWYLLLVLASPTRMRAKTRASPLNSTSASVPQGFTGVLWGDGEQTSTPRVTAHVSTAQPDRTSAGSPSLAPSSLSTAAAVQTFGPAVSSQPASPPLDGSPSPVPSAEPAPVSGTAAPALTPVQQRSQGVAGPTHQDAPSQLNVGDEEFKGSGRRLNSLDPLLAGLLSVFIVTTAVVFVVLFLKFRHQNNNPEFHRLQDLPMDDLMEDTPLSRYTY